MRFVFTSIILFSLLGCAKPTLPQQLPIIDTTNLAPAARSAITKAIKDVTLTPNSAQSWVVLGLYAQAHGLNEEAVTSYQAAKFLTNTPTKTHYWLAIALAEIGRYEEAITSCNEYEHYAPAIWRPGYWLMDLGRIDEAANVFSDALNAEPKTAPAMLGLGRARLQQNRVEEAIQIFTDMRTRGGDHPYLSYLLGRAYQRAGRSEEAAPLLKSASIGPPKWDDPWLDEMRSYQRGFAASIARATEMLDRGNATGALASLQQLAKAHPRNPVVLTNLANVQLQLGQTDAAIKTCSNSIRWSPNHAPSTMTMALAMFQIGEMDQAASYCNTAIELQPANAQSHSLAGRIAFSSRKLLKSVEHFERSIAIGNNKSRDREILALAYLDLHQFKRAIAQFNLVLSVTPNATRSIGGKAITLFNLGKHSEANILLQTALQQFPNDPNLQRATNFIAQQRNSR